MDTTSIVSALTSATGQPWVARFDRFEGWEFYPPSPPPSGSNRDWMIISIGGSARCGVVARRIRQIVGAYISTDGSTLYATVPGETPAERLAWAAVHAIIRPAGWSS